MHVKILLCHSRGIFLTNEKGRATYLKGLNGLLMDPFSIAVTSPQATSANYKHDGRLRLDPHQFTKRNKIFGKHTPSDLFCWVTSFIAFTVYNQLHWFHLYILPADDRNSVEIIFLNLLYSTKSEESGQTIPATEQDVHHSKAPLTLIPYCCSLECNKSVWRTFPQKEILNRGDNK